MFMFLVTVYTVIVSTFAADTCTTISGTCQAESLACQGVYLTGRCPGAATIKCCAPTPACDAVVGKCQDESTSCSGSYLTGKCPGPTTVKCCTGGSSTGTTGSACRTSHGNIQNLSPTGKKSGGVTASQSDVKVHLPYLQLYRNCFDGAADQHCIQASVLAAIASRESGGGSLLNNGYGDSGNGYGIMQCDIHTSGLPCTTCPWNSCCHVTMMTGKVIQFINEVKKAHPDWPVDHILQGGVAAYNFGSSNVRTWSGLDQGTTGDDYSNDVIARAKYLYSQGWN